MVTDQKAILDEVGTRKPGTNPQVKTFGQWLETATTTCPNCGMVNE